MPTDTRTENHHYINNCFGAFYRGTLNYFASQLYPFNYKVIGTYDKAVEYFNKKLEEQHEVDEPILPAITLDPSGDFNPSERGGTFLWQYPNLYPAFGAKLFNPIYKDDQVMITPVFTRFTGTFELICWVHSVYEYIDLRTLVTMWSGGLNRYVRPEHYWSYIVMPDEILDYEYKGSDSVEPYKIDWRGSDAVITLIRSMDQEKIVYPVILSPMYKITSLSDAGEKYGGTDFPSYKLQISCEFEIDLPTYLHIKADWKLNSANINLQMGGVHTLYGKQPPSNTLNEARKEPDPEYKGITNMTVYEIPLEQLDDSTTLIEVTDVWPSNTDIIDWNAVTSGRLIMINNESDWDLVGPDDIIYCQTFNESHITEQRIANGFITIDPANTDYIKSKAGLLNKPVFSGLSITDISILLSFNGNIITLDSYRNKIYLGKFIAIKLRKTEDGWGSDNVRGLSITNPEDIDNIKNKFTNQSPTIQTIFSTLDIHNSIDFDIHDVVYYEFSDSDIELKSDEHVVIPYTHDIVDKDQIKMISYIGELEYEKHYNLDLANKTITLKFPAKEHEGVEIYFYKIIS